MKILDLILHVIHTLLGVLLITLTITLLLVIFTSCGTRSSKEPNLPPSETALLKAQLIRVEPLLNFCDGGFAFARPNNIDNRPNCDTGDSMIFTGILTSVNLSKKPDLEQAIIDSISLEGQPHRSPSYKANNYSENASSRDQFIGFFHYLITTKDTQLAKQVIMYTKSNDNKLCPVATDNRCDMTPGIKNLTNEVYGYIGLDRPYSILNELTESVSIAEAQFTDVGFQLHLISQKIYIATRIGTLNSISAKAASILYSRQSKNLWFAYLDNLTHEGNQDRYNDIKLELIKCLRAWEKPGNTWTYEREANSTCNPDAVGSDLVFLGKLLINE